MKKTIKLIAILAVGFIIGVLALSKAPAPVVRQSNFGGIDETRTDATLTLVTKNLTAASSSTVFAASEARGYLTCSNIGQNVGSIYLDFGRNASINYGFYIPASSSVTFAPNTLVNVLRVSAISRAANKITCTQRVQ